MISSLVIRCCCQNLPNIEKWWDVWFLDIHKQWMLLRQKCASNVGFYQLLRLSFCWSKFIGEYLFIVNLSVFSSNILKMRIYAAQPGLVHSTAYVIFYLLSEQSILWCVNHSIAEEKLWSAKMFAQSWRKLIEASRNMFSYMKWSDHAYHIIWSLECLSAVIIFTNLKREEQEKLK